MIRRGALMAGMLLLGGCALPIPIQVASWALDGIILLTTEKTVADHGISLVLQEDCVLWRGVSGDQICVEERDGVAVGLAQAPVDGRASRPDEVVVLAEALPAPAAALVSHPAPTEEAGPIQAPVPPTVTTPAATVSKESESAPEQGVYFVLGSFFDERPAAETANRHGDLLAGVIETAGNDGRSIFRVVVGPFEEDDEDAVRRTMDHSGVQHAWAMRLDPAVWRFRDGTDIAHRGPHRRADELALLKTE